MNYLLRSIGGKLLDYLAYLDHVTATYNNLIEFQSKPIDLNGRSIAVYVTYQKLHNDKWEANLFATLRDLGFTIYVVINSNKSEIITSSLSRKNRGYDLAAVRDFLKISYGNPKEFLIVNSSVAWGPGSKDLFLRMRSMALKETVPIISAVESIQKRRHAQSFLFYSTNDNFLTLRTVYLGMKNWRSKRSTVKFGELMILEEILKLGVQVEFLFPYKNLTDFAKKYPHLSHQTEFFLKRNIPVNPTQHFWKLLLLGNAHFVKRNLISNNPARLDSAPGDISSAFEKDF